VPTLERKESNPFQTELAQVFKRILLNTLECSAGEEYLSLHVFDSSKDEDLSPIQRHEIDKKRLEKELKTHKIANRYSTTEEEEIARSKVEIINYPQEFYDLCSLLVYHAVIPSSFIEPQELSSIIRERNVYVLKIFDNKFNVLGVPNTPEAWRKIHKKNSKVKALRRFIPEGGDSFRRNYLSFGLEVRLKSLISTVSKIIRKEHTREKLIVALRVIQRLNNLRLTYNSTIHPSWETHARAELEELDSIRSYFRESIDDLYGITIISRPFVQNQQEFDDFSHTFTHGKKQEKLNLISNYLPTQVEKFQSSIQELMEFCHFDYSGYTTLVHNTVLKHKIKVEQLSIIETHFFNKVLTAKKIKLFRTGRRLENYQPMFWKLLENVLFLKKAGWTITKISNYLSCPKVPVNSSLGNTGHCAFQIVYMDHKQRKSESIFYDSIMYENSTELAGAHEQYKTEYALKETQIGLLELEQEYIGRVSGV
jgi:hypothetical protein